MQGAEGTLYDGEQFKLQLKFGARYPLESPEVNNFKYIIIVSLFTYVFFLGYICRPKHSSSSTCV